MKSEKKHEIIIKHLRKSRNYGKHILKIVPDVGSAIIDHEFILTTEISDHEKLITTISLLPIVRLYKKDGNILIDDAEIATEEDLKDYE